MVLLILSFLPRQQGSTQTLRYTLQGLALSPVFLVAVRFPRRLACRALNHRWVRTLGVPSYAVDLVRSVVLGLVEQRIASPIALTRVPAAATLLVAWVLRRLVERPFIRLRKAYAGGERAEPGDARHAIIEAMLRHVIAAIAALCIAVPAAAQVQRAFPQDALRGVIAFGLTPEIQVNGVAARLAPGARIRDGNNTVVLPGAVSGGRFVVHYTADTSGLVKDVWILRPEEIAVQPWPTTREQAETWRFDPVGQFWVKP